MTAPFTFADRSDGWLPMVLALLVLFVAGSRPAQAATERPNVLVIVSDDQRPDTIGALGNPYIETPSLDQLVRSGAVFTRAVSPNPICTPARAEILTGCSGFRNGVLDFGKKADPELPLWSSTMRAAGYHTWYVGKWHTDGKPIERGYEESQGLFSGGGKRWAVEQKDYNGRKVTGYSSWLFQQDDGTLLPEKGVGVTGDISSRFADHAIEFIRRDVEKPFFLHVNFTAPHDPLLMPPGYEGKYPPEAIPLPPNFLPEHPLDHGNLRGRDERLLPWPRTPETVRAELAVYYAVIADMDEHIGRMIAALRATGQWDETVVIFTSDHGLGVGSHGIRGKQNMYEHTVGVPLIFHGPGIPRGKRFDAQVYLRDLYPTVCELAGVDVPDVVQGKSLTPILDGRTGSVREYVFCYFRQFQRMVRTGHWKLIHYPQIERFQMFDLAADPFELRDLSSASQHARTFADLHAKLVAAQQAAGDPLAAK